MHGSEVSLCFLSFLLFHPQESFNSQGRSVESFENERSRWQAELQLAVSAAEAAALERDGARKLLGAANERAAVLAAELVGLEEQGLRARAQQLRLERELVRFSVLCFFFFPLRIGINAACASPPLTFEPRCRVLRAVLPSEDLTACFAGAGGRCRGAAAAAPCRGLRRPRGPEEPNRGLDGGQEDAASEAAAPGAEERPRVGRRRHGRGESGELHTYTCKHIGLSIHVATSKRMPLEMHHARCYL